jgi:DNA-binding beta-propeller fold protein YncE
LGEADRHSLRIHTKDNVSSFRIVLTRQTLEVSLISSKVAESTEATSLAKKRIRFEPDQWQTIRISFAKDALTVQMGEESLTAEHPAFAETKSQINFIPFDGEVGLRKLLVVEKVVGHADVPQESSDSAKDTVGRQADDSIVVPVNQRLTPFGLQIELPGMRPQALALSPDGKSLAVSGKTSELVIIDPVSGEIRQRVSFPNEKQNEPLPSVVSQNILQPDLKGLVSYTGLLFSEDGKRIVLSNVNGSLKIFNVSGDEPPRITPSHTVILPPANALRRKEEIPSGLAWTTDNQSLLVCGNLSNRLLEIGLADGNVIRSFDVGVAPYDVVRVGKKAYVSNWGGGRPQAGDLTGPAGRGTVVKVDPIRHIANEGSVTVIDLAEGTLVKELRTGLHASALAVSPDQRYVVCANAGDDHLSIIDVARDEVIETIWAKSKPSDLFGAAPNALAFSPDGERLFVANGSQNAVAVMEFEPGEKGDSKLLGLVPVGWYPGALVFDKFRKQICVANIKGHPHTPKTKKGTEMLGFNSHHYHGSLSLFPLVDEERLALLSEQVGKNMRREAILQTALPPRADAPPRPIPERIGEPSTIEHVVYIIKENRTFDQIFGKLPQGRGDPSLCIFGEEITPNQHKLVREFVLLDNTYCSGILSADGHQWSTSAMSTDYLEKSFAGFPRSYPDGMGEDESDALAYSPAGFLWDNAVLHKKTIRNYGEFMMPKVRWRDPLRKGKPEFLDCFRTWRGESDEVIFESAPAIESIRSFSPPEYVGWSMEVPDQYRADVIIRELKQFEASGKFPQLVMICLPNDHTSGTKGKCPTPAACMADNDLAFGRIVDALSHSKFWSRMAIFAIEDDPQDGWDHISGYRTTAFCISPFAKRGQTIQTNYNTTSILRTIEQILGLPPMNQFDASATPLFDCFSDRVDASPFDSVPNLVPLDRMNPQPQAILDPQLRQDALVSATLNFEQIDMAPEDVLNRILWRSMKGTTVPYPEWAVSADDDDE